MQLTTARRRACIGALAGAFIMGNGLPVAHATTQGADPTVLHLGQGLTVRWHLQAGVNAVAEQKLFWNLAETTAPGSGYDADKAWLELYLKPGLSFERALAGGATLYGKLSAVASYTAGTDAFDDGHTGATTLEEAYIGLRGKTGGGLSYDGSLGPRELKVGTGMLIASGASSGFERGALKFGPRKAWDRAVIGRVSGEHVAGTAFYLSPNELPSSDSQNELAGLDIRHDDARGGYLGATWLQVINSGSPYAQAAPNGVGAPTILAGAREGTRALSLYARANPLPALPAWTFAADFAYEWNDRIDLRAWAGRVQVGYALAGLPWSPHLSYGYQTFSGYDPGTTKLERFDPLYYEGNPSAWSTGSKSSMTFINSNVQAHSIALRMQPTARDTLTLRYSHVRANELRSPIQFGQATRVDTLGAGANVVAGVTTPHLADDLFLEFNRVLNRNTFLSAGLAISVPGKGIRGVTGGEPPNWSGGYVNVVVNY
jgi:Alginate export